MKLTDEQKNRALYKRILLSIDDLIDAHNSAIRLLELDEFEKASIKQSSDFVAHCLCLVISYSRPFINSENEDIAYKRLPGVSLKSLTREERALHNNIISLRQKEFAHSDPLPAQIQLNKFIYKDSDIIFSISRSTRYPFSKSDIIMVKNIVRKLFDWLIGQKEYLSFDNIDK